MKFNKWTLGLAAIGITALLTFGAFNAPAQTPNLLPTDTFAQSAVNYFTGFDTNSTTFTTERAEIFTAVDQSPDNLSAIFGIQYEAGKCAIEGVIRNASVVGTIESAQAGIGYSIVHYDAKIVGGIDGGYYFAKSYGFAEVYLDVRKALTANTYAGLRLYYDQSFSGNTAAHAPGIWLITGFKI